MNALQMHHLSLSKPCRWLIIWAFQSSCGVFAADTPLGTVLVKEQALPFRQYDKVEITGSSIVRKEQKQALPVQIITRDAIRNSGFKTVAEVVQSLPLMGNFVESAQLGMVVGGYNSAAIHGMPNATLVLVDGLRMAPFGRPTVVGSERSGVDLSTLPLADIERMEILSDGASSLYGTDAIAGVVNIILRKERKGFEITADTLRPSGGAATGRLASLSWGQGQLQRDGYSLLVTGEVSRRGELMGSDRPYASAGRYEFVSGEQTYAAYGGYYTAFTSPATLRQTNPAVFVNHLAQDGQCTESSLPFSGQRACFRNAYPSLGIYPSEEAQRLHARGQHAIPGGGHVFADVLLGRSLAKQANNWWPATFSAFGLSPDSLAHDQAIAAGLDPVKTRLLWMPDVPALRSASEQTSARLQLGMDGQWQSWDYQGRVYGAQNKAHAWVDNFGNLNYDSLGLGLNQVWNNDNVMRALDANNLLTAQVLALRGDLKKASTGSTRLYGVQAKASRTLAEIDGLDVLFGTGFDFRTESSTFQNHVPAQLQTEPQSFDVSRQVRGVFAELQVPMSAAWEVNLGVRSDQYSDVGSTHNAKLFSRWQLNTDWSMRGSMGTGFRAPNPAQTQRSDALFVWGQSSNTLSCDAQQQAITEQLGVRDKVTANCTAGARPFALGAGNPDLRPEKSIQMTWGMAWMPHRNLRLAADLWSVRVNDLIQTMSDDEVLAHPSQYSANYGLIPQGYSNSGAVPGSLALFLPLQNLGASHKTGLDFEMQWREPTHWGRWQLSGQATYLLRSTSQATTNSAHTSDLGRHNAATGSVSPRLRLRAMLGLTRAETSAHLIVNHTSGYQDANTWVTRLADDTSENVARRVSSFTTWDLQVLHALGRQADIRLGIQNILNRHAPLALNTTSFQVFGANTVYSNLWGRTLSLGVTWRF